MVAGPWPHSGPSNLSKPNWPRANSLTGNPSYLHSSPTLFPIPHPSNSRQPPLVPLSSTVPTNPPLIPAVTLAAALPHHFASLDCAHWSTARPRCPTGRSCSPSASTTPTGLRSSSRRWSAACPRWQQPIPVGLDYASKGPLPVPTVLPATALPHQPRLRPLVLRSSSHRRSAACPHRHASRSPSPPTSTSLASPPLVPAVTLAAALPH